MFDSAFAFAAALSLAAWLYLVFAHGRFWLCDQRLDGSDPEPARWPDVVAVVPARDEADLLPRTLAALLDQQYPGRLRVVLVDDESEDGTSDSARETAKSHPNGARLEVTRTPPRPNGWVGKMWAVETGVRAGSRDGAPEWWWLTDADVLHAPDSLARLVAKGEAEKLDLVSLMVKLDRGRGWNALLVPAFVYFFQQLYPFPRVNDPSSAVAGAAGGCMLVRAGALARAGGIESLRGEVIDDCALGRAVKRGGHKIWLGLAEREASVRPYADLEEVWNMVARSAYTQLGHSPALLAGTLAGLALLYLVPAFAVLGWLFGSHSPAAGFGAGAWLLQATSFVPTLTLYRRSPWLALALPVAGALYAGMTFDSARRHWRNEGATWKGRAGAGAE
jgi:hopene-associated glycosyltransferase HpnB